MTRTHLQTASSAWQALRRLGAACLLAVGLSPAQAAFSPETVGAVHFDLKLPGFYQAMPAGGGVPPGPIVPLVGGACGTAGGAFAFFACRFVDGLAAPNNDWVWETEILNPTAGLKTMNMGFFFPGGPILGVLTLGAGSTFHIGINIKDGLFLPEVGVGTVWYAWRGNYAIGVDSSVVENIVPGGINGAYLYHFHSSPDDSFVIDNSLTADQLDFSFRDPSQEALAMTTVPEPASALLLGAGALLLAWRRRQAAGSTRTC